MILYQKTIHSFVTTTTTVLTFNCHIYYSQFYKINLQQQHDDNIGKKRTVKQNTIVQHIQQTNMTRILGDVRPTATVSNTPSMTTKQLHWCLCWHQQQHRRRHHHHHYSGGFE